MPAHRAATSLSCSHWALPGATMVMKYSIVITVHIPEPMTVDQQHGNGCSCCTSPYCRCCSTRQQALTAGLLGLCVPVHPGGQGPPCAAPHEQDGELVKPRVLHQDDLRHGSASQSAASSHTGPSPASNTAQLCIPLILHASQLRTALPVTLNRSCCHKCPATGSMITTGCMISMLSALR
jgi:hypothetical protein